jgi:hypothetical protein
LPLAVHRFLLTILLVCLGCGAGTAQAAWTYMGNMDGNTVMIDRTSIQIKGRNAMVWMLTNYPSETAQNLLSSTTHLEFDCDQNKVRYLQVYGYEGQMQTGARLISVTQPSIWVKVEFGTLMKSFQQLACLRGPLIRKEGVLNKPPK